MNALNKLLSLLNFGSDEGDSEEIDDYLAIINSSKYADSNSNTEQLERLLSLLDPGKGLQQNKASETNQDDCAQNGVIPNDDSNRISIESIICRESDGVLPGQPVYTPARFGKEGGRNFTLKRFDLPRWVLDAININDTLLWVEEAQQAIEMRRYDMYGVMLAKHEDFYLLEIPGLAEGRPSLLRGDRLILNSDKRASNYEGYIHEVREKDILFKLHEYLHLSSMDGLRFNVQFISSRTPFRRCHHGVYQYKERRMMREMVFPMIKPDDIVPPPLVDFKSQDANEFPCFKSFLNVYQRKAVMDVLRAQSRPAPYVIFGPPGTGKTVTLVEAVLQVYTRAKDFKILVCANSNSSADLCARRIKDSGVIHDDELIRVSAFYRMENMIPPDLEDITKDMDMIDAFSYSNYRIVVTTCIQSGSLYEFVDRFDYVFIDEAGHASEPESLIAMGLLHQGGCCVLAGDPHQLGPICVSRVAEQYGLGISLLDRLSRRTIYQRNCLINNKMDYNSRYITKLRICYRCDPRVLSINNKMFYDGDLKSVNETPEKWLQLLKVESPLIFHSVKGRDRREYTNPSWFNPAEAIRCLTYVKRLYQAGLKPDQLGIISPYRRQIEKLDLLFERCNLKKCKIATVEEFQGDEREVIIISMVRTRERKLDFDKKFQLGFLFNPRRFNVAVSRAKWLVILIGDPNILGRDTYWSHYMNIAHVIE